MLPYWLLFFLAAAPALNAGGSGSKADPSRKTGSIWGAGLLGAIMAVMIGLRYEVGADWFAYIRIFETISYADLGEAVTLTDPGFGLLNWGIAKLGLGYWAVNLACGAIFTYGLFAFAFRLQNPWLAIAVAVPYLILVVAMGYSRQGVALACVLLALNAASTQSLLRFFTWLMVATAFHASAIGVLPVVGFAYTRNRIAMVLLASATAIILYYLIVAPRADVLLQTYVEDEYRSQGTAIRVAMNVVPALIFMIYRHKFYLTATREYTVWRNFAVLSLAAAVALVFVGNSTALDRLALYLIPLQLFVLSNLPYVLGWGPRRGSGLILSAVLLYSAVVQFVWLNYADHSRDWLPYQIYPVGERIA